MSNNLSVNPVRVDTAMGSSFKSSILPTNGAYYALRVEKWYWENPASVGDTVSVTDPQGNVILPLRCEVAGQSQIVDWTAHPKLLSDFQVGQITSGILWVYLA